MLSASFWIKPLLKRLFRASLAIFVCFVLFDVSQVSYAQSSHYDASKASSVSDAIKADKARNKKIIVEGNARISEATIVLYSGLNKYRGLILRP